MNQCQMHHDSPSFNLWLIIWRPLSSRLLKQHVLFCMTCTFPFNQYWCWPQIIYCSITPHYLKLINHNESIVWITVSYLALKTKLLNTFNNFIFCPLFHSVTNRTCERARETVVSLSWLVYAFKYFFLLVSSERTWRHSRYTIWQILRRKGDSTALQ